MDNLHEEATHLADTHSPYMLAKMLLIEQKERIELAAHVERLNHQIEDALRIKDLWLPFNCDPEHEGECQALGAIHTEFINALAASPAISLARRDKTQQARALEALSSASGSASVISRKSIDNIAADLRRQIEESN